MKEARLYRSVDFDDGGNPGSIADGGLRERFALDVPGSGERCGEAFPASPLCICVRMSSACSQDELLDFVSQDGDFRRELRQSHSVCLPAKSEAD